MFFARPQKRAVFINNPNVDLYAALERVEDPLSKLAIVFVASYFERYPEKRERGLYKVKMKDMHLGPDHVKAKIKFQLVNDK